MNQQSKLDIVDKKYRRTRVYGIICLITGEMYVGSTHHTLKERIAGHIQERNCRAIQILDRGNYKAYEIQRWPCNTLREVLTLEGGWQRAYKASFPEHLVNKKIEGYFAHDSPEASRAYSMKYREGHKEDIQAYGKQYYKKPWTCEYCNKTMTTGSRGKHKKLWCKLKPNVHEAQKGC
jgi:hypothetical protein